MMDFLNTEIVLVAFTAICYILGQKLYQKTNSFLFNPVLLSIVVIIAFLLYFQIAYKDYATKTKVISFWLNPSVVALAIPLYLQMKRIKKDWKRILFAIFSGSVIGIISVVLIAKLLGASQELLITLAPKSVSSPIAMNIAESIGGVPSLTAAVVVVTGIFGALLGEQIIRLVRVKNPNAIGLGIGTASHALGTARIATKGDEYSSYSAMGLAINGILTSLLTPIILEWLGVVL